MQLVLSYIWLRILSGTRSLTLNAHVILLTERPLGMDPFYTPLALYYVTVLPQRSLFENICSDYKTRAFQKEWTMRRMLDFKTLSNRKLQHPPQPRLQRDYSPNVWTKPLGFKEKQCPTEDSWQRRWTLALPCSSTTMHCT